MYCTNIFCTTYQTVYGMVLYHTIPYIPLSSFFFLPSPFPLSNLPTTSSNPPPKPIAKAKAEVGTILLMVQSGRNSKKIPTNIAHARHLALADPAPAFLSSPMTAAGSAAAAGSSWHVSLTYLPPSITHHPPIQKNIFLPPCRQLRVRRRQEKQ